MKQYKLINDRVEVHKLLLETDSGLQYSLSITDI